MVNADGHDDVDDGDEDGQGSKNCGSCNPTLENMETMDKRLSSCSTVGVPRFFINMFTGSPTVEKSIIRAWRTRSRVSSGLEIVMRL